MSRLYANGGVSYSIVHEWLVAKCKNFANTEPGNYRVPYDSTVVGLFVGGCCGVTTFDTKDIQTCMELCRMCYRYGASFHKHAVTQVIRLINITMNPELLISLLDCGETIFPGVSSEALRVVQALYNFVTTGKIADEFGCLTQPDKCCLHDRADCKVCNVVRHCICRYPVHDEHNRQMIAAKMIPFITKFEPDRFRDIFCETKSPQEFKEVITPDMDKITKCLIPDHTCCYHYYAHAEFPDPNDRYPKDCYGICLCHVRFKA